MALIGLIFVMLAALAGFFFLTAFSIFLSQPLQSSLVRLRANYLPRAVSLELGDDAGTPASRRSSSIFSVRAEPMKIGPVTSGVFGMAKRVVNLEGWKGLYRGSFPVAIQMIWFTVIGTILLAPFVASGTHWKKAAATGDIGTFALAIYLLIAVFVDLPMLIISHRTIVHPHPLPWTRPVQNLRELLSPSELRQPWRLYALPGMASVCLLHTLIVAFATPLAQRICFGQDTTDPNALAPGSLPADTPEVAPGVRRYSAMGLAAFLVFNIITIAITVPLQCATIRLSTQRPSEAAPISAAASEPTINPLSHQAGVASGPPMSHEEYEGENEHAPLGGWQAHSSAQTIPSEPGETQEPVVVLRPCASSAIEADAGNGTVRPYVGLVDCLQTMVTEEGIESIYRGWGVSVFSLTLNFLTSLI